MFLNTRFTALSLRGQRRQIKAVYNDRVLKITKCLTEKGNKYKIEMTNGRFSTSLEEYFTDDAQAIERAKPLLEAMIRNVTGAELVDIHSSFDVKTGERIEIFTLDKDLEKTCQV